LLIDFSELLDVFFFAYIDSMISGHNTVFILYRLMYYNVEEQELADIDDEEIESMILTPEEIKSKTQVWYAENKEYIKKGLIKRAAESNEVNNPSAKLQPQQRQLNSCILQECFRQKLISMYSMICLNHQNQSTR
jgi:predicted metal-dependent hydrolase